MIYKGYNLSIRFEKRRSLRLTIDNSGNFLLYCPKGYGKHAALQFFDKSHARLIEKYKLKKADMLSHLFGDEPKSPSLMYFGARYPIVRGESDTICFNGAEFIVSAEHNEEQIIAFYKEFLRCNTQKYIDERLPMLARLHGLSYNKVHIKSVHSRYGSCSAAKNLNFTLALSAFPANFIDMIICHELAHTVHLNHGKEFHALLDRIYPENANIVIPSQYSAILKTVCS